MGDNGAVPKPRWWVTTLTNSQHRSIEGHLVKRSFPASESEVLTCNWTPKGCFPLTCRGPPPFLSPSAVLAFKKQLWENIHVTQAAYSRVASKASVLLLSRRHHPPPELSRLAKLKLCP